MTADKHLLFGLLALQNEFIDKSQLVKAFGFWMADRSKPLDEILVQQQALKEEDRALLSRLVDRHVAARGGDVTASLRSLSSVGEVREELEKLSDPLVTASMAHLRAMDPYATVPSIGQSTSSGQRFEIRRPLARGGLGVVSIAIDKELNREIALKEIRSDRADDESYRTKFVLEAEVTGGLEHPGIVPVYGLGTGPDGRPYYAMRLIKGDNLQEHVKRFHKDVAAGKEPFDGTALRKLLRRFLDVCQAIDYAHSRGVLHRDLKPGNIMLGKYGETLVVDWGLAKPRGVQPQKPSSQITESSIETPLVPSGSDDGMTIQGSIIGTAAYAPPEQLSGDLDQVNERSDVYGLGAMLYELLTGQPPAQGDTLQAVIKNVLAGNIKAPRSIQSQVPKPLEAICQKAIARRPEDRYATAAELGQEIELWLDDQPVKAYPEPSHLRMQRWLRGHRVLVAGASTLLMTAVVLLTASTIWISGEQTKTLAANAKLERVVYATRLASGQTSFAAREGRDAMTALIVCDKVQRGWEHDYLYTQFTKGQTILSESCLCSAASPDGRFIAIIEENMGTPRTLRLLSQETCTEIKSTELPPTKISSNQSITPQALEITESPTVMEFTEDGSQLLIGRKNGELLLFDTSNLSNVKEVTAHEKHASEEKFDMFDPRMGVSALCCHGDFVATGGFDGEIRVWRLPNLDRIWVSRFPIAAQLPKEKIDEDWKACHIMALTFSSDGSKLASLDSFSNLRILNSENGSNIQSVSVNTGYGDQRSFEAATLSDTSNGLMCIVRDSILMFEMETGKSLPDVKPPYFISGIALSPNEKRIAGLSSDDKTMNILSFPSLEEESAIVLPWLNDFSSIQFLRDDKKLLLHEQLSGPFRRASRLVLWNQTHTRETIETNRNPEGIAFAHSGTELYCIGEFSPFECMTVDVARDRTFKPRFAKVRQEHTPSNSTSRQRMIYSSDDKTLVVLEEPENTKVVNAQTGAIVVTIPSTCEYQRLVIDSQNRFLAMLTTKRELQTWDLQTGQLYFQIEPTLTKEREVNSFNPRYQQWSLKKIPPEPSTDFCALSFTPDGRQVVAIDKFYARIVDLSTKSFRDVECKNGFWGRRTNSSAVIPPNSFITSHCLRFNSSGSLAAVVGGIGNGCVLIDTKLWKPVGEPLTHNSSLAEVSFMPNGDRLATGDWDGNIKIWDTYSGTELLTIQTNTAPVLDLTFSADGHWLASSHSDGQIRIWDASRSCP